MSGKTLGDQCMKLGRNVTYRITVI